MTPEEFLKKYLESEEGSAILTLIAYTIRRTPTEADDAILENTGESIVVIADAFSKLKDVVPSDSDAKKAGILLLEKIAALTKTPWDDRVVALLKPFMK